MSNLVNQSIRFLKKNSSTILTGIGAIGVICTTVLAVKATPKAMKLIEETEKEKGEKLTKLEIVKAVWKPYIPAALFGASTIACIFGANILNKRSQASLVSAYALLDASYKDYKKKNIELNGVDADKHIKAEIAKDKYDEKEVIEASVKDSQLFYDEFSGRYFESTMEKVMTAEYELNREITIGGAAFLNEFYLLLGIPLVEYGDKLGWSAAQMFECYWEAWVHFEHEKVIMDDGLECTLIRMTEPSLEFEEY